MKRKRKSFTGSFENYISKEQAKRTKEDHFLIYHISPVFNNLDGFDKELIKKILIAEIDKLFSIYTIFEYSIGHSFNIFIILF